MPPLKALNVLSLSSLCGTLTAIHQLTIFAGCPAAVCRRGPVVTVSELKAQCVALALAWKKNVGLFIILPASWRQIIVFQSTGDTSSEYLA